jgi:dual specificity phosphatase 12
MQKVTDQICVGAQTAVPFLRVSNDAGITHILNCTERLYDPPKGMNLYTLAMPDNSECDPAIVWRGIDFIRKAVSEGGKVLVHCVAGISRSRALVAAYLHLHHGISWEAAKAEVLRKRPVGFGISKKTEASVLRALAGHEAAQQA